MLKFICLKETLYICKLQILIYFFRRANEILQYLLIKQTATLLAGEISNQRNKEFREKTELK